MEVSPTLYKRIVGFVGSRKFFFLVVALFAVQAAWIALTARYPQAFDEQFHFGIIQIYSHQLSPFLTSQPPHSSQFGALTVDPSYLYHYLMSFPYRLIAHFIHSQTTQIIILRFVNIALLASGLVVFRKVLLLAPLSKAMVNTALLFFVLLPAVPLLGAQINYDNLTIPLSGLSVLWTLRICREVREHKRLRTDALARLVVLCLLAGLVKYEFFAVAAGIVLVLLISVFSVAKTGQTSIRALFGRGFNASKRASLLFLCILVIISLALIVQRDGVNLARYHKIAPGCNQLLSQQACSLNGPWNRAHYNHLHNPPLTLGQKITYPGPWFYHNIKELTFAISSSFASDGIMVNYYTQNPLPVVFYLMWIFCVAGLLLIVAYIKRLWLSPVTRSFIIISSVYVLILFVVNYADFLYEREVVAVHGRYLFPVLLLLFGLAMLSTKWCLEEARFATRFTKTAKVGILVVAFVLMLEGGVVTYIVRSSPSWFWPQSEIAQKANSSAQTILSPLVVGG